MYGTEWKPIAMVMSTSGDGSRKATKPAEKSLKKNKKSVDKVTRW